ncbi:hypothetical protein ACI2JR_10610 [Klebsiella sp. NPDC088457]|uniref:hypothetical protein n=1 Tax=Raoultella sp. BIGb0138 TaxID=2485115 RepID=UPI001404DEDB|nr:hypothetical protein [Raoultella sp. BIGb0138]
MFRTLLFPAMQVNCPGPVSSGPGNPAFRQEKSSLRDTFVSRLRRLAFRGRQEVTSP